MTHQQLVFENRAEGNTKKPFRFGPLTESRVDKAIDRIVAPYTKTAPTFLALSPGEQIAISGQRDSHVTFEGVQAGGLHYKAHSGFEMIRPLKRISFGLRFDIYSAGYWTRDNVQSTIPSSLVTDFKPECVSRVQSAEIVVIDKKTGNVYPMWLSLGVNRDRILEKRMDVQRTELLPQRTELLPGRSVAPPPRVMQPEHRPDQTNQPSTVCILAMDEAMKIATGVYRRKTLKYPITEVKMVFDSLVLNVAGQGVIVSSNSGTIRVKYKEDGKQRETTVSPEIIKNDQRNYVNYGGSQFYVVYTVFNLKTRSNGEHSDALVFASIYTWDSKHYGTFVFGAA
jgi:hypothetical protein